MPDGALPSAKLSISRSLTHYIRAVRIASLIFRSMNAAPALSGDASSIFDRLARSDDGPTDGRKARVVGGEVFRAYASSRCHMEHIPKFVARPRSISPYAISHPKEVVSVEYSTGLVYA